MSSDPVKILLIEDNPADARLLREAFSELRQGLFQLEHATRLALGLERLEKSPFDAVLLDLSLPDGQGIDNVSRVREAAPAPPIIVLTGFDDDRTALQAVRAGAQDYLVKDQIDGPLLARAIQYAIERKHAQETIARYQDQAALNLIANTASQSLQLEEILEITVAKVIEVTGCEMAHIRLRNPASGEITLVAHHGLSPEHVDTILARQELTGTLKRVFSEGELIVARGSIPVVINGANVSGESRLLVWVPLKAKGAVVGVLTVATMTRERFSAREVDLLKAIGNVVGIGLENARLFTETRRQLGRIEALRDISVAASSSLNLARVLKILLEKLGAVLPYSAVTIRLFDKQSGELRPATSWNLDDQQWKATRGKSSKAGLSGIVFETKRPLAIRRFLDDPRSRRPEVFREQGLVSYLGVPMIANGEAVGVLSIYTKFEHDFPEEEIRFLSALANQAGLAIHNSQLYEQLSSQAAELARSNKVKDEFLSVMSHEFKTPLNVILGYCGLLTDGALGGLSPRQRQALEKIGERGRELLAMLSAILEVTRIETEEVPLLAERIDLDEFFAGFQASHDARLEKDVVLEWCPPEAGLTLNSDRQKLRVVLEQLLNNAIQFTDSGKITVSLARADDDRQVSLCVADTGVGIPAESQERIFEKFTQLDSSSRREHEGIGLGLYLVRKFVDLLGGEVRVQSEVGVGSSFEVRLPVDDPTIMEQR